MSTRIPFPSIPKPIIAAMMGVETYVNNAGFDARLLELIRFRVSQLNQCAYCLDMHFKEAVAAGEDVQRLYSAAVWKETNYYSEQERAVLEWAESVTSPAVDADQQAKFEKLQSFYEQAQIADLTMAIIQINAWNRLARAFGFEAGSYQVGQH